VDIRLRAWSRPSEDVLQYFGEEGDAIGEVAIGEYFREDGVYAI